MGLKEDILRSLGPRRDESIRQTIEWGRTRVSSLKNDILSTVEVPYWDELGKSLEKEFGEKLDRVSNEDVKEAVEQTSTAIERVLKWMWPSDLVEKVKLAGSMIKDFWNGCYSEVPWLSIGSIALLILYIINPMDIVPDFIPVLGWMDDMALARMVLAALEADLEKYRRWKMAHPDC